MGEIAEMMLEGELCECCGTYLGEGNGFPRYCSSKCARDRGAIDREISHGGRNVPCLNCGKKFSSERARDQHYLAKHKQEDDEITKQEAAYGGEKNLNPGEEHE